MRVHTIKNDLLQSCTYVLYDDADESCWLIDIGDFEAVKDVVGKRTVKGVFITHSHYDHIYGIRELVKVYPDCIVYTCKEGKEGLLSDKYNFSRYHGDPISFAHPNVRVLNDGDIVELYPGYLMMAMHTPGHDKSCMTYYTDEYVFSGDSYIPDFEVVTTFPRSNKQDSIESLKKIFSLLETRQVKPGHQ